MNRHKEKLRTGFTTGACAAAAARAATLGLLQGRIPDQVACVLPNQQTITFLVEAESATPDRAQAAVIKDAGDDPDITHGARITASARPLPNRSGEIRLLGGPGVGRVTRPGVGLPVGVAAINPVPRQNILENIQAVAKEWLQTNGLEITLTVPGGQELAKRTLNPRLGIVDGISILGTSGIVHPYSTAAFKAAMSQSIAAAALQGADELLLTTGRRTERFARALRPDLPEHACVQMGDFVGAALTCVAQGGFSHLILAAMPGKLTKIAQGLHNTHARKGSVALDAVAQAVRQAGGSEEVARQVANGNGVRLATELLDSRQQQAFGAMTAQKALSAVRARLPDTLRVTILLFDFEGHLITSTEHPG